jgi:acyl CoA:acetate/3-ketoacid CoA transferase beta subunit
VRLPVYLVVPFALLAALMRGARRLRGMGGATQVATGSPNA